MTYPIDENAIKLADLLRDALRETSTDSLVIAEPDHFVEATIDGSFDLVRVASCFLRAAHEANLFPALLEDSTPQDIAR